LKNQTHVTFAAAFLLTSACTLDFSDAISPPGGGVSLALDLDVWDTKKELVAVSDTVIIGTPVGESRYQVVEMLSESPLANYFRDVAIDRTVFGSATGVITVTTIGWNPESSRSQGRVLFEPPALPMMGPIPDGRALFFLRKFPSGSALERTYELIGQDAGYIGIEASTGSSKARTQEQGKIPELRGRDVEALIKELQSELDKR